MLPRDNDFDERGRAIDPERVARPPLEAATGRWSRVRIAVSVSLAAIASGIAFQWMAQQSVRSPDFARANASLVQGYGSLGTWLVLMGSIALLICVHHWIAREPPPTSR